MSTVRPRKTAHYILGLCVILLLLSPIFARPVYADMGPKPSLRVDFVVLDSPRYYVTLLAEAETYGPYNSKPRQHESSPIPSEVWDAFAQYEDADGYHFWGMVWDGAVTQTIDWGYYPPEKSKILFYFPDRVHFLISETPITRYAFHSVYRVDLSGFNPLTRTSFPIEGTVTRGHAFGVSQVLGFAVRLLLTLAIEVGIGLLFGFWARGQIRLIALTNIATQLALNILLFTVAYFLGGMLMLGAYFILELIVIIVEGSVYRRGLARHAPDPSRRIRPWLYALAANLASFGMGLLLVRYAPQFF